MNRAREWLYATFPATPPDLLDLAAEYYSRTEAYDLTVCTGPMGVEGILPTNPREMALISQNARVVYCDVLRRALRAGVSGDDLRAAIRTYRP